MEIASSVLLVVALAASFEAVRRTVVLVGDAVALRRAVSISRGGRGGGGAGGGGPTGGAGGGDPTGSVGGIGALSFTMMADMLVDALSALPGLTRIGKARRRIVERRRADELRGCMPEMLRLLCIALDAGSSLVQALEYAADNCDEPLAGELQKTVWDLKAGQGFDEAMERLRRRTGGSEFSFLAVAMEIQHCTGGSLSSVLDAVSSSIRQTVDLARDLETQTTQSRLSAKVVACMPVGILAILSLFSPGYLASFFTSPLGIVIFCLAVLLELAGILGVRHALAVDLGSGSLEAAR